ncbi:MAG: class I SAM-dependent methyltransferase [bacterium]|nr:class I SAM-dependent methyltransferase [bacterium]
MTGRKCKICRQGVGDGIIHDAQLVIDYYYCARCGFIFKDDRLILPPGMEKERYLQHNNTTANKGYVEMLESFIEESVLPYSHDMETALDYGSGPVPVLATVLRNMGYNVDIYDIYFAPGKIYEGKTYDLVTCTEVVEHLKDPMKVLTMLKNLLNPGGILAIMTLFHPVQREGEKAVFNDWWYRRDRTHISFFRRETFEYIAGVLNLQLVMMDDKNTLSFQKKESN